MKLREIIAEKKAGILSKWFDAVAAGYPADTAKFIKRQKDRFANPVGHTLSDALGGILDCIAEGADLQKFTPHLDDIVRVRAIQEFSPSEAVGFVFTLKGILWSEIKALNGKRGDLSGELRELEGELDAVALRVFEIYSACRERLYEIRSEEVKRNTFRLLKMAKIVTEVNEEPENGENGLSNKTEEVDK